MADPNKLAGAPVPPATVDWNDWSYDELLYRQSIAQHRVEEISVDAAPPKTAPSVPDNPFNKVPRIQKADTHWDFLLKEMQWLAADFAAERKRHLSSRRKLSQACEQDRVNRAARRQKEIQQAGLKQRKLAQRQGNRVLQWWNQIDKVIAYQQKEEATQARHKAMNQQLVKLVHLTERYTKSLSLRTAESAIEQALTQGSRRSRQRIRDYAKLRLSDDDVLYGESTADDSGSNASYDDESDDESTLRQAEEEEARERQEGSFMPNPEELRKLQEESTMPIDEVIQRLGSESSRNVKFEELPVEAVSSGGVTDGHVTDQTLPADEGKVSETGSGGGSKQLEEGKEEQAQRVSSLRDDAQKEKLPTIDVSRSNRLLTLNSEDDVMDSVPEPPAEVSSSGVLTEHSFGEVDVKSELDSIPLDATSGNDDVDFVPIEMEVDDETTIEAEEKLGRDMSYGDELALLEREREMPIEELRRLYASTTDDAASEASTVEVTNESSLKELLVFDKDAEDRDEFEPDQMEVDDETTIEAEEQVGRDMSCEDEISLLEEDKEVSIDELRAKHASVSEEGESPEQEDALEEAVNQDGEFEPDVAEVDDETTLIQEENLGREMSYEDEINILNQDNELSVEELRAKYAAAFENDFNETEGIAVEEETERVERPPTDAPDEDAEFQPNAAEAVDDETTLLEEEKLGRDMTYEEEIDMLNREKEMSVEELRAMYGLDVPADDAASSGSADNDEANEVDEEYKPQGMEVDDETTIEAEERLGREMSAEDEIAALNQECDMSLDELRSMYNIPTDSAATSSSKVKRERNEESPSESERKKPRPSLPSDDRVASFESPTRATKPFILSPWVKLRPYQQIGLGWLVSLQARRLNGILADEMGLGKTLQTISLLSYLAAHLGVWGPHLVVVPTSVILNWETELKRFAPGLKVLCYYGTAKRRKELRTGWTKTNWYHVVITSYQLAVQDAFAFKRKRWYYLILDEAQNIKNFQSQRWQTLINFNTQRRLLLTGTPLQNNLMELWSLLHFLMPHIFRSRKEFSYWFANPMDSIIEGTSNKNDDMVNRLHGIIRPFVLRRLKKDVETQMPGKFEHIVKCQLSRRQMFIYEEFMGRSSTRQALKKGGNYMGMMNVLMQLRKVCNHPDLFEPRSVVTPFVLEPILYHVPSCVVGLACERDVQTCVSPSILRPLWSGSCGLPSLKEAQHHGPLESAELLLLENDLEERETRVSSSDGPLEVMELFYEIKRQQDGKAMANVIFLNQTNKSRCRSRAFPYSERFVDAATLSAAGTSRRECADILSTPLSLIKAIKNECERAANVESLVKNFVFCVPKAGGRVARMLARVDDSNERKETEQTLLSELTSRMVPYQNAQARLTSFFPDKKLVQFDAGKLQTLAELLLNLKRGGHRALIFTQMSKMLDILEAFLNLNGHTYLRLDGSTGVDRRQRLMDRFNNDTKVFCFILSTRSGGMGVNLTGADTVIFYDNDWNPAMDAQAQDRAHRIGQTRDVHIYRLITEHTIEENILIKAKQKKNLDILVMDRGKFDASSLYEQDTQTIASAGGTEDLYSKGGLRAILGVQDAEEHQEAADPEGDASNEQIEKAMASLEDDEDLNALKGAQKEAADELVEFDESIEYEQDGEGDEERQSKPATAEVPGDTSDKADLEKEIAAWQDETGMDAKAMQAALSPMERYGLQFRSDVDPYVSIFAIMEQKRLQEAEEEEENEVDIDAIEYEKSLAEKKAIEDGDLLVTDPQPEELVRQRTRYLRERSRLRANKKLRKLTGQDWERRKDALTQHPFWYNIDSGEALWNKPQALLDLEALDKAKSLKWNALPKEPLLKVLSFLAPSPDRHAVALLCHHWKQAARDVSFIRHVYPVEMGAHTRDESKIQSNHYRTIADAVAASLPGDTIELGDGHYWLNEDVEVKYPLRLIGDEHNPGNVVLEMGGTLQWTASGGFIEGVTLRRPKLSTGEAFRKVLLQLTSGCVLHMVDSVLDNEGGNDDVVRCRESRGDWKNVLIRNGVCGIHLEESSKLSLDGCQMRSNDRGILCESKSETEVKSCRFQAIRNTCIELRKGATAHVTGSQAAVTPSSKTKCSIIVKEDGCVNTNRGNSFCGFHPSRPIAGWTRKSIDLDTL